MTTTHLRKSIGRSSSRLALLLIPLVFACFALSPTAQAQLSPPPDGGYENQNTAEGTDALFSLTNGVWNTAVGFDALFSNTVGNQNTALGYKALFSNVDGHKSVAVGAQALTNNITGNQNTATGFDTLFTNTTGNNNTGNGYRALHFNNGDDNTATGFNALYNNRTGRINTALGSQAAQSNKTGDGNTAVGFQALFSNDGVSPEGSFNTAHGSFALWQNRTGEDNCAFGNLALGRNVTGSFNTAIGSLAGDRITGFWNIDIGADVRGTRDESFVTRIGISDPADLSGHVQRACFIGGIVNAPITGAGVVVSSTGQLGVAPVSSARFKDEIKPMNKASEVILGLKPVTFSYKKEIDPQHVPQFGLVAEEVEKVNPDLVTRDAKGELYTVRYDAVNAMLLNEFLKEHHQVQDLKAMVAQQQKQIEMLTAGLQKVSAQVEASKPAPQVVNNNQ